MLFLLLSPLFSSSASLHASDPISAYYAYVTAVMVANSAEIIVGGAIAWVAAGIGGVAYYSNKAYESCFPTPEQIASIEAARLQIAYIAAKNNFIKCLQGTKPESKRNEENVPAECEKTAMAFIICGGVDEVFNMTRSFKPQK